MIEPSNHYKRASSGLLGKRMFTTTVARAVLVVPMVLAACATPLTERGGLVRELPSGAYASQIDCHFLGVIEGAEGSGFDVGDDRRGALNQIRNQAANIGANAFVVSLETTTGLRTTVQAEAFHCPSLSTVEILRPDQATSPRGSTQL